MIQLSILCEYRDREIYFHHSRSEHPRADNLSFSAHFHDCWELYYFISGEGYMSVEGAAMYMESGDCLLMRPAETHAMHINPEQPYERMALLFQSSVFSCQLAPLAARLDTYKHARVCRSDDFIRCCLELIVNAADSERRAVIVSMLGAMISRLSQSSSPVERPDIYGHDRLTGEIIAFVNEHLFCDWNLDTLAAALYRDKSYLNRHFKRAVGATICDYAKKKRLIAARQHMLLHRSVAAGFSKSGFGDYSTFWRQYKRMFGCSPTDDLAALRDEG